MHDAPAWLKAVLAFLPTNQFAVALRGALVDGGMRSSRRNCSA